MPNRPPIVLALFAIVLLPISPPARAAGEDRVILVTIDGFRWQEVFGGAEQKLIDDKRAGGIQDLDGIKKRYWRDSPEARREALMPFLWTHIARHGQVFGDP